MQLLKLRKLHQIQIKNLGGLISRTLANDGAKIALHYHSESTLADAEKTVSKIKPNGGKAFSIQGDFTQQSQIISAFAKTKKHYSRIDIAINTIGKVLEKPFSETT